VEREEMRCPICDRSELTESVENYHYRECGLENITLNGVTVRRCPECGVVMPKISNIEGLHDCIAKCLVKKEERLLPAEIVFLRKSLGWSSSDLARNMQTDKAQVSKWEHGRVEMSKSNELLFREIIACGKKITDYRREDAARKAATLLRLFMELDNHREWKLAA
jgi:putative zinc finger/helix-turn-helix YgiT family protein